MVLVGRAWFGIGFRTVRVPGQAGQAVGHIVPASRGDGARELVLQRSTCPGTWTAGDGGLRRGGYLSCDAAAVARDKLIVSQPGDPGGRVLTVAHWLETWVGDPQVRLRDSTRRMLPQPHPAAPPQAV